MRDGPADAEELLEAEVSGRDAEVPLTELGVKQAAALGEWLRSEGTGWASSSTWQQRTVICFAVSNHGTDVEAVRRTVGAVARGAAALGIRG